MVCIDVCPPVLFRMAFFWLGPESLPGTDRAARHRDFIYSAGCSGSPLTHHAPAPRAETWSPAATILEAPPAGVSWARRNSCWDQIFQRARWSVSALREPGTTTSTSNPRWLASDADTLWASRRESTV